MIKNSLRLTGFCLPLILIQFLFNNLTSFYFDLVAIILISLLLNGGASWTQLIILSLAADLSGHWLVGSHLLAITILSIFSGKFISFYRLCNWFQRSLLSSVFYLLLIFIIFLIELASNQAYYNFKSVIIEVLLILPLLQLLLYSWIIKKPSELIIYE
jgi:hypothetical protein